MPNRQNSDSSGYHHARLIRLRRAPHPKLRSSLRLGLRSSLRPALRSGLWLALWFGLSCATPAKNSARHAPASSAAAAPPASPETPGSAPAPERDELSEQLRDPSSRDAAIELAIARFDALAANGTRTAEAQAFIDRYAPALTQLYVENGSTSAASRLALLNLLVSFDRPAARPAYAAAIARYAKTSEGADEAIWAARAATRHTGPALRAALLRALRQLDVTTDHGQRFSTHLREALEHNNHAEWTPPLGELARAALERPQRFDDHPAMRRYQNQLYRTRTAVALLGAASTPDAARAVLDVLLDPHKHAVYPDAEAALLQLGVHALAPIEALLEGEPALKQAATRRSPELAEPHVHFAARALDLLRHPQSESMLRSAWAQARSPEARIALARSLCLLPGVDAADVVRKSYAGTPVEATLPQGESALEILAEAAARSYAPDLVPWLARHVARVPPRWGRRGDVQRTLVMTMTHLMNEDQLKIATAPAMRYGGRTATPYFERARALVSTCRGSADCYLEAIDDASGALAATKAAYMVAIWGDARHRDALVARLPSLKTAEVLDAVLNAIEEMTPQGAAAVAEQVERHAAASSDPSAPKPRRVRLTARRLAARR